MKNYF